MKLCRYKEVALGEGRVHAFTLIEIKHLFSVIFYKWETIDQVRFHTHAFPSIAFLLWGAYTEERIVDGRIETNEVRRRWVPRWLPRNYCHSIKRTHGFTMSMVLVGPWQRTWWEFFPPKPGISGYWQEYTWGRQKLGRYDGTEHDQPDELKEAAAMRAYLDSRLNV